ncbi:hypothetical protein C0Q70_12277 [Pomacea canaliculata]|uniref:CUB domain-containing protein n=1 Tax=Pomacea canaliculata TaxID=400727 RepID=A0A2T7P135_POMCA|nr:hypothetical protein C0Q70_12277 [Pomacea canaliculata]
MSAQAGLCSPVDDGEKPFVGDCNWNYLWNSPEGFLTVSEQYSPHHVPHSQHNHHTFSESNTRTNNKTIRYYAHIYNNDNDNDIRIDFCISVCPVNATTLDVVPGQVGHVTSPNYPSPYYNNANCRWLINAGNGYVVKVTVLNFNLETGYDYLELYNGKRVHKCVLRTGQLSLLYPGKSVTLRLFITPLSIPVCTSSGTNFSAVPGQVGYLSSLYYPSVYSGFISCSWTIISTSGYVVKATVLNATNPQFYFNIVIYDVCTSNGTTFSAVPGQVGYLPSLYFPSVYSGFISCSWTIISTSGYVVKATILNVTNPRFNIFIYDVCSVNAPTIYAVPGQVAYLTSPNYPSSYYNNADCRWLIDAGNGSVVKVTVLNVNLETCCDYLELYNVCSVNATTVTAVPGQVGYLTSPNYPSPYYNKADCRWLIDAGSGYVVKVFNLSLEAGFLELYDACSVNTTALSAVVGEVSYLESPDYPNYPNYLTCKRHVVFALNTLINVSLLLHYSVSLGALLSNALHMSNDPLYNQSALFDAQ